MVDLKNILVGGVVTLGLIVGGCLLLKSCVEGEARYYYSDIQYESNSTSAYSLPENN